MNNFYVASGTTGARVAQLRLEKAVAGRVLGRAERQRLLFVRVPARRAASLFRQRRSPRERWRRRHHGHRREDFSRHSPHPCSPSPSGTRIVDEYCWHWPCCWCSPTCLAFSPPTSVCCLGRALFGIGIGGFWAIGAGLGARLVPAESAGKATSIIFAGVSIGMLVGGSAGAFIGELFGWRTAFGVSLLLSLISLAAQALYLPALRVNEGVTARGLLGITRTRNGRVGPLAMLLALVGQYATYTYITPLLASDAGYDGKTISLILLGYTVVGMVGNFVGGATSGRHLKSTLALTIVFCALPAALLPFAASAHTELLVVLAVWGIAYGAMPVALQMWMARAAPKASEGAMALFVSNFQISISLGSFLGGLVVDYQGLRSAMFFGAIVGAVGFVVLWLGTRGEATDEENDPRSKSFESTRRQSGARA